MRTALALAASACLLIFDAAHAEPLSVGVAAPLSGPLEPLGRQVRTGAAIAAGMAGVRIMVVDDSCTAEGGRAAAQAFAEAKVAMAVGFLCTDAIEAALPILKDAGIPVITVGVRTESLTDQRAKTGWPVYRLAPRGDDERNAAAALLTQRWRDQLFAIVDDGTIYGRELAETVRNGAEQTALKPVFTDTYRPDSDNQVGLVGRLKRAGAARVFVGGDGSDVAVMARDAAKLGADIVFAGGEALRSTPSDVPYADGTLMVALPEWAEIADQASLDAFKSANAIAEGYSLPAYVAVEIAATATEKAIRDDKPVAVELTGRDFASAIGPIRFDEKGDLSRNPYRLFRYEGGKFVAVEGQ